MEKLQIEHLVLDYNGTIAINGKIIAGVKERLETLVHLVDVHVLTADTYGSVYKQSRELNLLVHVIGKYHQNREKLSFIESLKPEYCVAIDQRRARCTATSEPSDCNASKLESHPRDARNISHF